MLAYTNGFQISTNAESGELIIRFIQNTPDISSDGLTKSVSKEAVAEVVMVPTVAKGLSAAIGEIFTSIDEN